ncbi:MAG TPA: 3-keto-5-aminohexanoate cleavage protein [Rhizomicrobium sp.]|nr:3-keto-5-aminohexanoate cleavage protein [Rhizomicrobium sp.]
MHSKVILTCAVSGSAPLNPRYPAELRYPVTPARIAESALEAAKAGASVVHIHVRDPKTGDTSREPHLFRETVDRLRQSGSDVVINLTCGGGAFFLPDPEDESRGLPGSDVGTVENRVRHIRDCLPEICSLDVTTANQVEGGVEHVYLNTTRTLRGMAKIFKELGVKPELETFQAGDVMFANQLVQEGLIEGTPLYQFVLGVKWGAPATPETMMYMRNLLPPGVNWTGFGISRDQMPMVAQAVLLGGHVRVGLEDNLYLDRGQFATNAQLVERAVMIIESLGAKVATPDEARAILGLKPRSGH